MAPVSHDADDTFMEPIPVISDDLLQKFQILAERFRRMVDGEGVRTVVLKLTQRRCR